MSFELDGFEYTNFCFSSFFFVMDCSETFTLVIGKYCFGRIGTDFPFLCKLMYNDTKYQGRNLRTLNFFAVFFLEERQGKSWTYTHTHTHTHTHIYIYILCNYQMQIHLFVFLMSSLQSCTNALYHRF
jgi:hypothetical protein